VKKEGGSGHSHRAGRDASGAVCKVAFCWCVMPRQKGVSSTFKKRNLAETSQIFGDLLGGFKACASRKPICADDEVRDAKYVVDRRGCVCYTIVTVVQVGGGVWSR
jgi:hypothetical protein